MPLPRNSVILLIDRLNSAYLGPYGNTWLETPLFNRLASEAILYEAALADSPDLTATYRSLWEGCPATLTHDGPAPSRLPDVWRDRGVHSALITDSHDVTYLPVAESFAEKIVLHTNQLEAPASEVDETQFARLVAAAIDWLATAPSPFVLWIHAQAMQGPWDAPLWMRELFREEDDPPPSDRVKPPDKVLGPHADPDQLLIWTHAYAGQVSLIDTCLGPLLDAIRLTNDTAWIVSGVRGFALGEHGRIGAAGDGLNAETLQIPLFVRLPDMASAARRINRLTQPVDLHATLAEQFAQTTLPAESSGQILLFDELPESDFDSEHDYVCSVHQGRWSIRTPLWFLREGDQPALYVKPDDRFEVNEIADRCPDIVDQLLATIEQEKMRREEKEG